MVVNWCFGYYLNPPEVFICFVHVSCMWTNSNGILIFTMIWLLYLAKFILVDTCQSQPHRRHSHPSPKPPSPTPPNAAARPPRRRVPGCLRPSRTLPSCICHQNQFYILAFETNWVNVCPHIMFSNLFFVISRETLQPILVCYNMYNIYWYIKITGERYSIIPVTFMNSVSKNTHVIVQAHSILGHNKWPKPRCLTVVVLLLCLYGFYSVHVSCPRYYSWKSVGVHM